MLNAGTPLEFVRFCPGNLPSTSLTRATPRTADMQTLLAPQLCHPRPPRRGLCARFAGGHGPRRPGNNHGLFARRSGPGGQPAAELLPGNRIGITRARHGDSQAGRSFRLRACQFRQWPESAESRLRPGQFARQNRREPTPVRPPGPRLL